MSGAALPRPVRAFLDELRSRLRAASMHGDEIERAIVEAEQHLRDAIEEGLRDAGASDLDGNSNAARRPDEAVADALRRFGSAERHADELVELWRSRRGWRSIWRRWRGRVTRRRRPSRGRAQGVRGIAGELDPRSARHVVFPLHGATEDLLSAVRLLRRRPTFAFASIVTLALGIGAATTIFSLASYLLWRPLPGVDPAATLGDGMFAEWRANGAFGPFPLSYPDVTDVERELNQVAFFAGYTRGPVNVAVEGSEPRRLDAENVTASFFRAVGLEAHAGRAFSEDEDDPAGGAAPVVVISHRLWRSAFGAEPEAIGRSLWVNGVRLTIIGVAPPGFLGMSRIDEADLWLPGALTPVLDHHPDPAAFASRERGVYWQFIVRLAPGATWEAAEIELNAAAAALPARRADPPDRLLVSRFQLFPGVGIPPLVRPVLQRKVQLLAIVVGLVLLLACSNVAGLLLLGGLHRHAELAVRKALGASAWRLTRQHLTEGLVLWLFGGAVGMLVAVGMVHLFEGTMTVMRDRFVQGIQIDARVLAFAILLSLGTGTVFAAIPAVSISRTMPSRWLGDGPRTTPGRWRLARSGFTVIQLAASLAIVLWALLFIRTLQNMNRADLGFDPSGVTLVGVSATDQGYDVNRLVVYYRELVEGLRGQPQVEAVGLGAQAPLDCCAGVGEVRTAGTGEAANVETLNNWVSGDFFRALDIPVLRGRVFADADSILPPDRSPDEVVISRSLAERLFGDDEAVGRSLVYYDPDRPYRIIGVVDDASHQNVMGDSRPMLYFPAAVMLGRLQMLVRSEDANADIGPVVRSVAAEIDPMLPPAEITRLDAIVGRARADARLFARLFGGLSVVALAISAVGLYGLVSFSVAARSREFGVRMALGAAPAGIRTMVLRGAVFLAVVGVGLGAAAAWAGRRLVESRLVGVSTMDPPTWGIAALVLFAVAIAAASIPARRATRVDPVTTLRET